MQISRPLFYWRKRYYGLWTHILVKNWWTGVVWIVCGLLWCFYQLFGLSFWRHPFTAEDPLVMQCYISPNLMKKNSSRSWMAWGGAHFKQMFIFGWTTPLRKQVHNGEVCGSTLQSFNTMYCRDSTDSIFHSAVLEN